MSGTRNRILVAVDGSEPSLNAVRYLAAICPPERTALTLFHVLSPTAESRCDRCEPAGEAAAAGEAWADCQKRAMQAFMARAGRLLIERGFPRTAVTSHIQPRRRGIARDILREATDGYRAVVAGRVGENPIGRLVMGSVAAKLVNSLRRTSLWLVDGCPDPRRVLLAVDSSRNAMRVVNHAGIMLGGSAAELLLFHVIRSAFQKPVAEPQESAQDRIEAEQEEKQAREAMGPVFQKACRKLEAYGFPPERIALKVIAGMATRAGTIYAQARSGEYGSIVMGRRGLSRVREFPLGRVTHKVVQLAQQSAVWVVA